MAISFSFLCPDEFILRSSATNTFLFSVLRQLLTGQDPCGDCRCRLSKVPRPPSMTGTRDGLTVFVVVSSGEALRAIDLDLCCHRGEHTTRDHRQPIRAQLIDFRNLVANVDSSVC